MKLTKPILICAVALSLSACGMPPAVTSFNGHSVVIRKEGGAGEHADVTAEAARICSKVGKRAEYTSITPARGGLVGPVFEYLYLCL